MLERRQTARLALLGASLVVSLIGVEIVLRLALESPRISRGNTILNRYVLRPDPITHIHLRSDIDVSMSLFWPGSEQRLRTNATGQRMDRELPRGSPPGTYRVATLGDSSTMGWGVPVATAYPSRLEGLLASGAKGGVEVLNFGSVGFSTYNGRAQLEAEVLPLAPDLVTLAFGFNDWSQHPGTDAQRHERDRALAAARRERWLASGALRRLDFLAVARRLDSILFPVRRFEPSMRVPLPEYERNLEDMVRSVQASGADAVLVGLNLANSYGEEQRRRVAAATGAPLLEVRRLFERGIASPNLEQRLDLTARPGRDSAGGPRTFFRFWAPEPGPRPVLTLAPHDRPYDPSSDRIALHDDASHGDQRAGDRVFSVALPIEPGTIVDYAAHVPEQSTPRERRRLYSSRYYHKLEVRGEADTWAPVHALGRHPLADLVVRWDVVHPNAEGHRRIAARLGGIIESSPSHARWRSSSATRSGRRPEAVLGSRRP